MHACILQGGFAQSLQDDHAVYRYARYIFIILSTCKNHENNNYILKHFNATPSTTTTGIAIDKVSHIELDYRGSVSESIVEL